MANQKPRMLVQSLRRSSKCLVQLEDFEMKASWQLEVDRPFEIASEL